MVENTAAWLAAFREKELGELDVLPSLFPSCTDRVTIAYGQEWAMSSASTD